MKPNVANQLREEAVTQALQTIERRVNELGVAEPIVARQGAADQLLVQLPGVTDVQRAKDIIRSTAILELKLVEQGPFPSQEAAMQAVNNNLPPDDHACSGPRTSRRPAAARRRRMFYIVRRVPAVTGRDLRNARPTLDENNLPAVSFSLNQDGARKFGDFTQANIGRQLAIILDNRVFSAPTIESADRRRGAHHRQLHAAGSAGPVAHPAVRRAAGVDGLPRGAHGRPVARRRLDPRRRARPRSAASRWSCCSCSSTTS